MHNVVLFLLDRETHSQEYCAMYDICGERSDGKVLNCPYGSPSVKVCIFLLVSVACVSEILLSLVYFPFIAEYHNKLYAA